MVHLVTSPLNLGKVSLGRRGFEVIIGIVGIEPDVGGSGTLVQPDVASSIFNLRLITLGTIASDSSILVTMIPASQRPKITWSISSNLLSFIKSFELKPPKTLSQ